MTGALEPPQRIKGLLEFVFTGQKNIFLLNITEFEHDTFHKYIEENL